MRRTLAYALAGGLLSAGAPVGLLGLRLGLIRSRPDALTLRRALRELAADRAGFSFVGASTAVVFTIFGYVLGRQADRLAELSQTDTLTGLSNARGFFERLETELARARRYGEPFALLIADVDGLKDINDRDGHHAGDEAIRCVADVIRAELRETDAGARWGGDEFAILAPNTAPEAARALAERVRASIPRRAGASLTASFGVATLDPGRDRALVDSDALMRIADAALYEAKRSGRNRVVAVPAGPPRGLQIDAAGRTVG